MLGNVKKVIDMLKKDEIAVEHSKNRNFFNANECRIDLRRAILKKCFQLKVKMLNGKIPTCNKMKMCNPIHNEMHPTCNSKLKIGSKYYNAYTTQNEVDS